MPTWFDLLRLMAAQDPEFFPPDMPPEFVMGPPAPTDPVLWPYFVAIGTLASAVAALFGWLMKVQADAAKEKAQIHEDNRKLVEARSVRVASEFDKERQERNDLGQRWAENQGRVAQALEQLADAVRDNGGGVPTDTVRHVSELYAWYEKNEDVLVYMRRDLERDQKKLVAIVSKMARASRESSDEG